MPLPTDYRVASGTFYGERLGPWIVMGIPLAADHERFSSLVVDRLCWGIRMDGHRLWGEDASEADGIGLAEIQRMFQRQDELHPFSLEGALNRAATRDGGKPAFRGEPRRRLDGSDAGWELSMRGLQVGTVALYLLGHGETWEDALRALFDLDYTRYRVVGA